MIEHLSCSTCAIPLFSHLQCFPPIIFPSRLPLFQTVFGVCSPPPVRLLVRVCVRVRSNVPRSRSFLKANKLTVMRSMVRAVSLPGNLGASRSSDSGVVDDGNDGDDLGGPVYSRHEEVPETRFSAQLRRYRALVRTNTIACGQRGGRGGELL